MTRIRSRSALRGVIDAHHTQPGSLTQHRKPYPAKGRCPGQYDEPLLPTARRAEKHPPIAPMRHHRPARGPSHSGSELMADKTYMVRTAYDARNTLRCLVVAPEGSYPYRT